MTDYEEVLSYNNRVGDSVRRIVQRRVVNAITTI